MTHNKHTVAHKKKKRKHTHTHTHTVFMFGKSLGSKSTCCAKFNENPSISCSRNLHTRDTCVKLKPPKQYKLPVTIPTSMPKSTTQTYSFPICCWRCHCPNRATTWSTLRSARVNVVRASAAAADVAAVAAEDSSIALELHVHIFGGVYKGIWYMILSRPLCVCVCVCVCAYIYIRVCVCVCAYVCVWQKKIPPVCWICTFPCLEGCIGIYIY